MGCCVCHLEGHTHEVESVLESMDGRMWSTSWDETLRVWDVAKVQCMHQLLPGHTSVVWCVVHGVVELQNGNVLSCYHELSFHVWDASTVSVCASSKATQAQCSAWKS